MAFKIRLFKTNVILIPASTLLSLLYVNVQLVMRYWVRTVSDSMSKRWGVIAITEVSNFLTIRFTVHTWISIEKLFLESVPPTWVSKG